MGIASLLASYGFSFGTGFAADPSIEFFNSTNIVRLHIEIPEAGLEILRAYEFRKGSNPEVRTNVAATVREGSRVYTNVAVHLKGSLGSFRPIDDDKPALTLNFDKWEEGQRFYGLQKISLNNSVQDPSYVSEAISRELFTAAGLPCPRATHALVQLNGLELGLYVLLEGWNRQFLKRHFANTRGNLWDSGSAGDINEALDTNSGESPEDRSRLDALVTAANDPDVGDRLSRLGQVLDLDRFYTFMAMEVMLAHWDGYCLNRNNYRVFHDRSTDRLIFLPSGMDQMFGQYRMTPTSSITPMMKGLAAKGVAQTPEGRRRYLERLGQLATNVFDVARITNRVNELSAKVQALGNGLRTSLQQQAAANGLIDRVVRRNASVRQQLAEAWTPLQFGPDNEVKLTDWRSSRDSGSPSFRRASNPAPTFEISASGSRAYGSWRTVVFLDAGDYQLAGRVKLTDPAYGQSVTNGGATVRISGERQAKMITVADDWTMIAYDFSIVGQADVELLCEFRATQGRAVFDGSSLTLRRRVSAKGN